MVAERALLMLAATEGLSIVKGVLEAHGAEYGVASTLGEGSDFWFRLPLLPPDAALTAESEENHSDFS